MAEEKTPKDSGKEAVVQGSWRRSLRLTRAGVLGGARVAAHAVGNLVRSESGREERRQAMWRAQAGLWAKELGELKGSLMKAGQMVAMYGDQFLPPEALQILRGLQNDAPPLHYASIEAVLVADLGADKVTKLGLNRQALGAASLGQVHCGTAPDGTPVAVKVQYPGVAEALDNDLQILRRMLKLLRVVTDAATLDALFAEVHGVLTRELDYVQERAATDAFRAALADDARLVVPHTFPELSSQRVLTTSFESGVAPDDPAVKALSQSRRNALGIAYFELYLQEMMVLGRVQTDPHFGNFRVRIDPVGEDDRLVLLDFGATREVTPAYAATMRRMMRGCLLDERQEILDAGLELGLLRPDDGVAAEGAFVDVCRLIAEPFSSADTPLRDAGLFDASGAYDFGRSDLPRRVAQRGSTLARARGLRPPPPEALFVDRKLAGTFLFLAAMGAVVDARPILRRYLGL